MVEVRAFQAGDIRALGDVQPAQRDEFMAASARIESVILVNPSWAIEDRDGVLAIGGLYRNPALPHRAQAWALVAARMSRAQKIAAVRIAGRILRQAKWMGIERVEATTVTGWRDAENVMRALGFEREAEGMKKYGPGGAAHDQWARV